MKIEVINSIWSKAVDKEARREITKLLKYEKVWFKQGQYSKIKKSRLASFVNGRSGFFLSGFLPKILRVFPKTKLGGKLTYELSHTVPSIKSITFRADQLKAIKQVLRRQRGVIRFATASGKTVIAGGIISCYDPSYKTVFLAHSKDIIKQTYERFKEYGFFDVGILTGDDKQNINGNVLCATYQTYVKIAAERFPQIIIVDECHHVNNLDSQYGKILRVCHAPVRVGLTGTLPNTKEGKLVLEGLIGPVIAKLSLKEGIDKKLISLPKITLISVRKIKRITNYTKYYELRDKAIVNNRSRNKMIAKAVKQRIKNNKSCLIIVNEIKHGENIIKELPEAKFLQGQTPSKIRERAKQNLINKRQLAVITTNIWNEGVDIPTLDVVVLAFGGKANTRTIQAIGRGLRRTDKKKQVEIIDFLDPYKYLAEHVVARLNIYKREKLL